MQTRVGAPSIALAATFILVLAACAPSSGASDTASDARESQAGSGASTPAAPSTAAEPSAGSGGEGGSNIDWATVDLTTFDWAAIDLRTVDWVAFQDNPTGLNLSDDDRALIASRMFPGSATLTLGDEVHVAQGFLCASGHGNTESDVYSFTSNGTFLIDSLQVIVQFAVRDPSGTGQITGDGVVYETDIGDTNFTDPSFSWIMTEAESVGIDGYIISVSGSFDDVLTEGVVEEVPGSLEAECGDQSRF